MTKQEIFEDAVALTFAVGYKLPPNDGDLSDYKVFELEITENVDVKYLLTEILIRQKYKVARNLQTISRQFYEMGNSIIDHQEVFLIFHIKNAQFLKIKTLQSLRTISEHLTRRSTFQERKFGIVLTGEIDELKEKMQSHGSLSYRMKEIPTTWKVSE